MIIHRIASDKKKFRIGDGRNNYNSLGLVTRQHEWCSTDSSRCAVKLVEAVDELLLTHLKLETMSLSCMFCDNLAIEGICGPMEPEKEWCTWLETTLHRRVHFFTDQILKRFEEGNEKVTKRTSRGPAKPRRSAPLRKAQKYKIEKS